MNHVFEILFVLLGLALLTAAIKFPKDILKIAGIPFVIFWRSIRSFISLIGLPLILVSGLLNLKITNSLIRIFDVKDDDDKPYPFSKKLFFTFQDGEKYIYVLSSIKKEIPELIKDLLGDQNHRLKDFKIAENGDQKIISCPQEITFMTFTC